MILTMSKSRVRLFYSHSSRIAIRISHRQHHLSFLETNRSPCRLTDTVNCLLEFAPGENLSFRFLNYLLVSLHFVLLQSAQAHYFQSLPFVSFPTQSYQQLLLVWIQAMHSWFQRWLYFRLRLQRVLWNFSIFCQVRLLSGSELFLFHSPWFLALEHQ